jgi:hypothetical protein
MSLPRSLSSMALTPDIQMRMGKKIAQLTTVRRVDDHLRSSLCYILLNYSMQHQVITRLNEKDEDSIVDFEEVAQQYEEEIQKILQETTSKLNWFKNSLENARDESRISEMQQVKFHGMSVLNFYSYNQQSFLLTLLADIGV